MPVRENPTSSARRVGSRERARSVSKEIMSTIEAAYADPRKHWFRVDHEFGYEGATSTASCIRRGFLRLKPKKGEQTVKIKNHIYPAVPRVDVEIGTKKDGVWSIWVRRPEREEG